MSRRRLLWERWKDWTSVIALRFGKFKPRILSPRKKDGPFSKDGFAWIQRAHQDAEIERFITSEKRLCKDYFQKETSSAALFSGLVDTFHDYNNECLPSSNSEYHGTYEYFTSYQQSGYPVVMRRKPGEGTTIAVDLNEIPGKGKDITIGPLKVSPFEKLIACCICDLADESYSLNVFSAATATESCQLYHVISDASEAEWTTDRSQLIYVAKDAVNRSSAVKVLNLETRQSRSVLEETDPRFSLSICKTKDDRFIIVSCNSRTTSEVYAMCSDVDGQPSDLKLRLIHSRTLEKECFVDHFGSYFYAMTSDGSDGEYMLHRKPSSNGGLQDDWEVMYCPSNTEERCVMQDFDVMSESVVVYGTSHLLPFISVLDHNGEILHHTKVSSDVKTLHPGNNHDPFAEAVKYQLSSPAQTASNCELNLKHLPKESNVYPVEDHTGYRCVVIQATSKDKTKIPVSVYYSTQLGRLADAPLMLHIYGCYGAPMDMAYSAFNAILLAQGWILAFCHARGGHELGRHWHRSAILERKLKTFEDFECAVGCLHALGYSKPSLTVAKGTSAGAVAVGTLCNRRSDLLKAAVLKVPFLDVHSAMMDSSSPLTCDDYPEFGDPRSNSAIYDAILTYCPYANLVYNRSFPSVFLTISLNDKRVPSWIPLKWLAKWRYLWTMHGDQTVDPAMICKIDEDGGHFGDSGSKDMLQEVVEELVFVHKELALDASRVPANCFAAILRQLVMQRDSSSVLDPYR